MQTGYNNISEKQNTISIVNIWLALFVMSSLIAFIVQLVVLPYIFPSWNGGHGLLVGMDSLSFHQIALELANKTSNHGWSNWEFRPSGQSVAGIMGAVYVLTGIQEPWIVIPIYTMLYATGGILLWLIIDFFLKDRQKSLLCLIPYIFLPSAIMLYAQPHKDMWQIVGFFCFIYGWCLFLRPTTWKNLSLALKALLIILAGAFFSWIVRPYCVQIMQVIATLLATILAPVLVYLILKKRIKLFKTCIVILLIWMSVIILTPFTTPQLISFYFIYFKYSSSQSDHLGYSITPSESITTPISPNPNWNKTYWLPIFIDQKLADIAMARDGFCRTEGNSNLDKEITCNSAHDIFLYLPRAMEIGFLSPFPYQWFEIGSTSYNTLFRRIAGLEMIITYVGELLLIWGITKFWRKSEIWAISISSIIMIMAYAFAIINVGTLYRERWGYIILLSSLGFAMFLKYRNQKTMLK